MMSGEDQYKDSFKILGSIPQYDHEELVEHLYKSAFNLSQAYFYFNLGHMLDELKPPAEVQSPLGAIFIMSVIGFMVQLRKVIDKKSKSNLRVLVALEKSEDQREQFLVEIDRIYSDYKRFTDQLIVHQDKGKITSTPLIPDYEQNVKDLGSLVLIYNTVADRVCSKYLLVKVDHQKEVNEFRALLMNETRKP